MKTKIKVSTEVTGVLKTVKPGDVVKSINYGCVILVVQTEDGGTVFNGFVLDKGGYTTLTTKGYGCRFVTSYFKPFIGTITLESR